MAEKGWLPVWKEEASFFVYSLLHAGTERQRAGLVGMARHKAELEAVVPN